MLITFGSISFFANILLTIVYGLLTTVLQCKCSIYASHKSERNMRPAFNYKKATQALNFLAGKQDGQINKMKALKLVYFADRYHLRKYGRLITNDTYYAMEHGPVASGVKDIAEFSMILDSHEWGYASKYIVTTDQHNFKSLADVDQGEFSDSDIEALEFAWAKFGRFDQFQLRDLTHKYPEWQKWEKALQNRSRIDMDIEDFLEDPAENVDKCFELTDEDRQNRREQLKEFTKIVALWS